ncbi:unnamed protein product [Ilex paraguariensis]|uniref:Non-specific lipid-transfer protein n=1 Tax=Ilex paraguariensis TaxID=185542 RepID=A0ABC8T0D6_9AQUA
MKRVVAITLLVVLAVAQFMATPSEATVTCGQVEASLSQCIEYLIRGGTPTGQCCAGVKNLKDLTQSQPDRQAACECLKKAATDHPNIKPDAASDLPKKCGVPISVPISPTVNCGK